MEEQKKISQNIVVALWNLTAKDDLLDRTAADILGLNHSDTQALAAILFMGPIPAGQISTLLRITTGASTALIDRLEKGGYARRLDDKTDRRKVMVEATEDGKAASGKIFDALLVRVFKLLSQYNAAELKLIERFLVDTGDLFVERVGELGEEIGSRITANSKGK